MTLPVVPGLGNVMGNAPPVGKGLYARGDLIDPARLLAYLRSGGYDWVAVTPNILRRAGDALRDAKFPTWLYSTPAGDGNPSTPDSWLPSQYERTIGAFEALCKQYDCRGYIADMETGWNRQSDYGSEARRIAAGEALRDSRVRTNLSIGLTTFPAHSGWRVWGPICGEHVWLNLQLYSTDRSEVDIIRMFSAARDAGWSEVRVPAVASYAHVLDGTPAIVVRKLGAEEFRAYVDKFPPLRGAAIWYPLPAPAGALAEAISRWRPNPFPSPDGSGSRDPSGCSGCS